MAAKKFRGWLELNNFVAAASGSWRRLGGLAEDFGLSKVSTKDNLTQYMHIIFFFFRL